MDFFVIWRNKYTDLKLLRARFFHLAQHSDLEKKFKPFSLMYVHYLCLDTQRKHFLKVHEHVKVLWLSSIFWDPKCELSTYKYQAWQCLAVHGNLCPSSPRWWHCWCVSSCPSHHSSQRSFGMSPSWGGKGLMSFLDCKSLKKILKYNGITKYVHLLIYS